MLAANQNLAFKSWTGIGSRCIVFVDTVYLNSHEMACRYFVKAVAFEKGAKP